MKKIVYIYIYVTYIYALYMIYIIHNNRDLQSIVTFEYATSRLLAVFFEASISHWRIQVSG